MIRDSPLPHGHVCREKPVPGTSQGTPSIHAFLSMVQNQMLVRQNTYFAGEIRLSAKRAEIGSLSPAHVPADTQAGIDHSFGRQAQGEVNTTLTNENELVKEDLLATTRFFSVI
jgi:hypothetical protein